MTDKWEGMPRRIYKWSITLSLAISLSQMALAQPSFTDRYDFDLKADTLGRTLTLVHEQTGIQLIYPFDQSEAVRTRPVMGRHSLGDAIKLMLRDTEFCGGLTESGVIVISRSNCALVQNREVTTVPISKKRGTFLSGVATMLFGLNSALAQVDETSPTAGGEQGGSVERLLDEVVITATKRQDAENVQDVALSVTAFNANTIDALNVQDLEDLTFSAPNVSLDGIGTFRGFAGFSIRGLGTTSSIPSIDPTVGVFIDGIYLGISQGVIFDLFDLDSIEVLRGPQGLLFGRNTTGGAVVINTANPTSDVSIKTKATIEFPAGNNFGGPAQTFQGILSGPLIKDKLNGKIGFYIDNDEGFFENQFTGENQAESETLLLRGGLEYFLNEDVTLLGKIEYLTSDGNGPAVINFGESDRSEENFLFAFDQPGSDDQEAVTASFRTDIDVSFGNGTITNIFGYRKFDQAAITDVDIGFGTEGGVGFDIDIQTDQRQFTNELRYAGTFDTGSFGTLDVTAGGFFFRQDLDYNEFRIITISPTVQSLQSGGGSQDHLVLGAFTNFDLNITPKLTVSAGLRYSFENKEGFISIISPANTINGVFCSVIDGTCPIFIPSAGADANGITDEDFDGFTPRAAIQYFPVENLQLYGNYSRGFRSGVFNFRTTNAAFPEFQIGQTGNILTDQETLDSFEVGFKYNTPDGRGKFNFAGFFNAVDGLIREVTVATPSGVAQEALNTADVNIFGVEVESSYAITDNFLLGANFGFLETDIQEALVDINGDGVINQADLDLTLTRAPQFSFGVNAVYDIDLGDFGGLTATSSFSFRDEIFLTDDNLGFDEPQEFLNFDLTWRTPKEGLTFSVYGQNLLNRQSVGIDTQIGINNGPLSDGLLPDGTPINPGIPTDPGATPAGTIGTLPNNGTFSPLRPGRSIGFELQYKF